MNIIVIIRILCNMTYEEYKNSNKRSKSFTKIIKKLFGKLFTVLIFTMVIISLSNYSPKFRNFLINDILNNSMNFSKINNILDKTTNIFKTEKIEKVNKLEDNVISSEKYKDGIKYFISDNEKIYVKDSGIVTYIGKKDGYNNTIVIQQSNGYYAWYGNIKEKVKLYDYVESGSLLGTASQEYYYVLLKDDKPIEISNES